MDDLSQPLPPDANGRIRHPLGELGGRYTKADCPGNVLGIFCPTCGQDYEYIELRHRACVVCKSQFPEVLCSARMRKMPYRKEFGEIDPESALGIVSTGNHSPNTIVAAAAIVAIDPDGGRKTLAASVPKSKPTAAAKVASEAEHKQAREQLRVVWAKRGRIHRENIRFG